MTKMTRNQNNIERLIRTIVGLVFLILTYYTDGVIQIILAIVGALLFATGVIGFCPLYKVLKIDTSKKKEDQEKK